MIVGVRLCFLSNRELHGRTSEQRRVLDFGFTFVPLIISGDFFDVVGLVGERMRSGLAVVFGISMAAVFEQGSFRWRSSE